MSDKIFHDPHLEHLFTQNGFVVINDFLSVDEINEVKEFFANTNHEANVNALLYTSNNSKNYDYRKKTSRFLRSVITKKAAPYLDTYKSVYAHFIIKNPGLGSEFLVHQDWTIIDENRFRGVTIWCPLTDVNYENGYMQFVTGSHLLSGNIRGSNITTEVGNLPAEVYTNIEIKCGGAIAFDHRIFHKSTDNISASPRIAMASVFIPEEACVMHYYKYPETEIVEEYIVDDNFFEEFSVGDGVAAYGNRKSGNVPFERTKISSQQLLERLKLANKKNTTTIHDMDL